MGNPRGTGYKAFSTLMKKVSVFKFFGVVSNYVTIMSGTRQGEYHFG